MRKYIISSAQQVEGLKPSQTVLLYADSFLARSEEFYAVLVRWLEGVSKI
jgi:hypothetical protein